MSFPFGRIATLPKDERVRLARMAGLASVASERGHRWTVEDARRVGRRGALAGHCKRTAAKVVPETETEKGTADD